MLVVSGCVDLYALRVAEGSWTVLLLRSVSPTLPSSVAATSTSLCSSVACMAFCPSTSTLAVTRRAWGIQLLDSNGEQSSASMGGLDSERISGGAEASVSLCWSADGFSLLANTVSTTVGPLARFVRYSVLQPRLPQPTTESCTRLLLLGADRLLLSKRSDSGLVHSCHSHHQHGKRRRVVQRNAPSSHTSQLASSAEQSGGSPYDGDDAESGFEDDAELSADPLLSSSFDCLLSEWDVVPLPASYASHACPTRCVSLSESGDHVAVAGSRGLCVWSRRTRKWRQMASLRDEWTLRPQHIQWLADHSILVHSRATQQSRQLWLDSVDRDRQHHVRTSNSLQWSLSSSSTSLPPPLVSSSSRSPSVLVSDVCVFPRSHLSFASVLCVVSFPAGCRVCDVVLSGSSLLVRASAPASLLFQFSLDVPLMTASRQPHRVSVSSSSITPPLSSPSASSPAMLPLSRPWPASSISTPLAPSSPLSLPSSLPTSHTVPSSMDASQLSSLSHPRPSVTALLPPSWRSSVRSSVASAASGGVRCGLCGVQQLPVELTATGLHGSARQLLLVSHLTHAKLPPPTRHTLLLLSDTGDLHCTSLPTTSATAINTTNTAAETGVALNDGDNTSVSWLAASHVSAVWTQPLSTLSPLSAAALVCTSDTQQEAAPLLLAFGLQGLRVIRPQPASSPLASQSVCSVTLPRECYPVAIDWRAGCVVTLRSYHNQHDESPSAQSRPAYALSLHPIPFLHRLLSACLPSASPHTVPPPSGLPSSSVPASPFPGRSSPASSVVLSVVTRLLQCCVDEDSALVALELFVHSELVGEECVLSKLPSLLRPSYIAAVHSLLAALASCLSTPCAYERVLVHVARKTDSSLWSRLFEVSADPQRVKQQPQPQPQRQQPQQGTAAEADRSDMGHLTLLSPTQLAAACMSHRQLHTATLYLLLIQRTSFPRAAYLVAVSLLRLMERRRQQSEWTTESASQLDELERQVQLDRQVRRFAQQTAAIVNEQRQQMRADQPDNDSTRTPAPHAASSDVDADTGSHSATAEKSTAADTRTQQSEAASLTVTAEPTERLALPAEATHVASGPSAAAQPAVKQSSSAVPVEGAEGSCVVQ